ncbi:Riboflavin biosynthesis protein RibD [Flavobacterium longum]|uniref:bifunctional diaminohydroxyphosphoribosylaminopyrimidine deaminase/5-amino-6-(5-phosphoribosylamino)uracil reductase RibD n=1 Tax=Flavobacterium longum TaxID=1299340 RepID=UPI0039EB3879
MHHELYMKRCLQLAENGLGTTYPNPLVGSVIVHKDTIIGEGWHRKSGEPHAEVNAVRSVKDQSLLKNSTLYVNLEPCSHFGKTPPCSDLIVSLGIPEVVIGTMDPHEKVAGKGIERLRAAGVKVTVGVLEQECLALNKRFFTFHNQQRPYVILKWAESADGFIAPLHKETPQPVWISGEVSRQLVHKWRSEEQSILVGTQTVIDDNPRLNVRDWAGNNQPIRLVIDKSGRIPARSHIFDNQQPTVVFSGKSVSSGEENIIFERLDFDQDTVPKLVKALYSRGIQSVIVEGGRQTLQSFIDAGLWDEARIFVGGASLKQGISAPTLHRENATRYSVGHDELLILSKP